jgi:hypothetical protein
MSPYSTSKATVAALSLLLGPASLRAALSFPLWLSNSPTLIPQFYPDPSNRSATLTVAHEKFGQLICTWALSEHKNITPEMDGIQNDTSHPVRFAGLSWLKVLAADSADPAKRTGWLSLLSRLFPQHCCDQNMSTLDTRKCCLHYRILQFYSCLLLYMELHLFWFYKM